MNNKSELANNEPPKKEKSWGWILGIFVIWAIYYIPSECSSPRNQAGLDRAKDSMIQISRTEEYRLFRLARQANEELPMESEPGVMLDSVSVSNLELTFNYTVDVEFEDIKDMSELFIEIVAENIGTRPCRVYRENNLIDSVVFYRYTAIDGEHIGSYRFTYDKCL